MIIGKTIYPKNRASWRTWLTAHHQDKKEIWVIYYKKATGKPTITYEDAVQEAVCFGWIDGMEKRIDDQSYAQRFSPRAIKVAGPQQMSPDITTSLPRAV